jgi:tetratricopeptide (TPR) repeat protein
MYNLIDTIARQRKAVLSKWYQKAAKINKVRRKMSKKTKASKQKKSITTSPSSQIDKYLDLIGHQIFQRNYAEAVATCERLLNYLPQFAPQRIDALDRLGTAQAMLQNFPQSYAAYTEALALDPNNATLWFNRGMASRFTSRFGRSLRDYERAKDLNIRPELAKKLEGELEFARDLAEQTLKLRGPDFTLDQLIEQEGLFQDGLQLTEAGEWKEAEQAFQASIAMDDCLPQPWGNLGISMMMQERYDEAEAALKRALVIDPQYTLAKNNLAALPEIRRTGSPAIVDIKDPFKDSKLKQSITFIKE